MNLHLKKPKKCSSPTCGKIFLTVRTLCPICNNKLTIVKKQKKRYPAFRQICWQCKYEFASPTLRNICPKCGSSDMWVDRGGMYERIGELSGFERAYDDYEERCIPWSRFWSGSRDFLYDVCRRRSKEDE